MARLSYPSIIERDLKYKTLADLGIRPSKLNLSLIISTMVDLIPKDYLILLAEKWSVTGYDGWLLAESDDAKRKLIKNAIHLHRYKGTPWAIREIVRQLGFGEITIIEGLGGKKHDGSFQRNGTYVYGDPKRWAYYRVVLQQVITNGQAALLRKTLGVFAPARCVLASLDYRAVSLRHNGKAIRNGLYNRGTA